MPNIVLTTNGENKEWFFRADLGGWVTVSPLLDTDVFPFPEEFDMFFIGMLAILLNPAYGVQMDQQTGMMYKRSKTQFEARYTVHVPTNSELALIRTLNTGRGQFYQDRLTGWYDPTAMFKTGVLF